MKYVNPTIALSFIAALVIPALAGCAGAPGETGARGETEAVGQAAEAITTDFCPTGIPAALTPAANQTLKSHFTGIGTQIYMCNATTAGGFAWTFVAPEANSSMPTARSSAPTSSDRHGKATTGAPWRARRSPP